jgi:hypothetical protein
VSSSVAPKIARNSMLNATASTLACRNIALNAVSQVAGWAATLPSTPAWPLHSTICENPAAPSSQWLARWVNS